MASNRAADVAEVLWELKRAGKVATMSAIAERAGFSPGADCKAVRKCLEAIRREWPHLEWWRAIEDDGSVDERSEQANLLRKLGIEIGEGNARGEASLLVDEHLVMVWEVEEEPVVEDVVKAAPGG